MSKKNLDTDYFFVGAAIGCENIVGNKKLSDN